MERPILARQHVYIEMPQLLLLSFYLSKSKIQGFCEKIIEWQTVLGELKNSAPNWLLGVPLSRQHCLIINTMRPSQSGSLFPDDIFKYISMNENVWISNKIEPKFVPKGSINNIPTLVQIMAWHHQVTSHYLKQWWSSFMTQICVTWPQWVKCQSLVKDMAKP